MSTLVETAYYGGMDISELKAIEPRNAEHIKNSVIFFGSNFQGFGNMHYAKNEWDNKFIHTNFSGIISNLMVQMNQSACISSSYSGLSLVELQNITDVTITSGNDTRVYLNDIHVLLQKIKYYQENNNDRLALRTIYNIMEDNLTVKNYAFSNKILSSINVAQFNLTILIAFLSSTFMWKNNLPSRKDLYEKIKKKALSSPQVDKKFLSLYAGLE